MNEDQNIKLEKKRLRQVALSKMSGFSEEYKAEASRRMMEILVRHKDYLLAGTIFIYVGTENEVNTTLIIKDALAKGKKVVVPKTLSLGHMEACEIDSVKDLFPGRQGILEPKDTSYTINPHAIDVAFIPCVAYTKEGFRLGYGGGFYDRYLPRGNFKRILVAFSEMEMEKLPRDTFDEKVQGILTEKGYYEV